MQFLTETVEKVHTKNSSHLGKKFVISTTGGGYSSHYYLMSQPGASNTILELNGPYCREATLDFLNRDSSSKTTLEKFASLDAAKEMAEASLKRCQKLMTMEGFTIENNYIGIGVVCSLASTSWKKGDHRCHVVVADSNKQIHFSLNLFKGKEDEPARKRIQEDELCGALVVCAVAVASGVMDIQSVSLNLTTYFGLTIYDTLLIE